MLCHTSATTFPPLSLSLLSLRQKFLHFFRGNVPFSSLIGSNNHVKHIRANGENEYDPKHRQPLIYGMLQKNQRQLQINYFKKIKRQFYTHSDILICLLSNFV